MASPSTSVSVRRWVRSALVAGVVAVGGLGGSGCRPEGGGGEGLTGLPPLVDLQGRTAALELGAQTRAVVFVFVGVECPISNRFLPELAALEAELAPQGVKFVTVYPFPDETPERIGAHRAEFGQGGAAYRDPEHVLARALGAHRTPEAVALTRDGRRIYQGRINDQYRSLGVARPEPTRHDLAEALRGFLGGEAPSGKGFPAVGCSFRSSPGPERGRSVDSN